LNTGAGFAGDVTFNNSAGGALQSLTAGLQALERVGLIRTLAEPTLTAISGETANFLSGGEFPLLTNVFIDEEGRLQREFEFKPYGVSLGFTPVVLSEGRISINISTEVSEPTTEGAFETGGISSDILGLRVRRASTVVELPAGGSLVIAGLIREESRQAIDGVPGLKDIPGLGAAFRNRDDLTTQTELVVIVTPYLVDPTHPDKLQTPLDGFVPANDKDALLLGRLNKVYGHKATNAAPSLGGPFGHVVD
jgi:pilus assembly protein CpaC